MSKYLITLTPTGKFFFGGDMAFSVRSKDENKKKEDEEFNSKFSSYIIRSNKFPQQTSLLGMLRFLILRNDENVFDAGTQKIKDRAKASELIGKRSFEKSGNEGDFGVIKSIGNCFLQVCNDTWADMQIVAKDALMDVDFKNGSSATINGKSVFVPEMSYDSKKNYETSYKAGENNIKESEIFIEDVCNGINRDIKTGKTEDNALFKQISYRLNNKFRFAFYAEVDAVDLTQYNGQLVSVGGDNSQFVIGIENAKLETLDEKGTKVVLESPAYLTKEDLEDVRFAITDTIPFKCMKTETSTVVSYNKLHQYGYSESFSLYDRWSVFFFGNENEAKNFAEKLKKHADFYQIGYNHYQVK